MTDEPANDASAPIGNTLAAMVAKLSGIRVASMGEQTLQAASSLRGCLAAMQSPGSMLTQSSPECLTMWTMQTKVTKDWGDANKNWNLYISNFFSCDFCNALHGDTAACAEGLKTHFRYQFCTLQRCAPAMGDAVCDCEHSAGNAAPAADGLCCGPSLPGWGLAWVRRMVELH